MDLKDLHSNMSDKINLEDYLKLISQLESSGGIQTNHPAAQVGINKGQHALGQYGLMPQTAYEVVHPSDPRKVQTNPDLMNYTNLNKNQLADEITKNPQLEHDVAAQYGQKILNRAQNPEAASLMWQYGASQPFSQDELDQSDRVQKFKRLRQALQQPDVPIRGPASIPTDGSEDEDQ